MHQSVSVCSSLLLYCFCVVQTGYRKWRFPWIGSGNFTNHFCCSNLQSIVWIGSETFTVFFSLWIGRRRFSLFEMWSTRNSLHPGVSKTCVGDTELHGSCGCRALRRGLRFPSGFQASDIAVLKKVFLFCFSSYPFCCAFRAAIVLESNLVSLSA